jgi:heme-degrading monooxygenase HmoA
LVVSNVTSVLLSYLGIPITRNVRDARSQSHDDRRHDRDLEGKGRNQWDRAMHERVRAASDMDGWVAVQLLREVNEPRRRAIIGTWQSREHWARWHDDETFKATRAELAGLEEGPSATVWYDVVEEQG